jgi:hypothetical protein
VPSTVLDNPKAKNNCALDIVVKGAAEEAATSSTIREVLF